MWPWSAQAAWGMSGRPEDRLAGGHPERLAVDHDPAAALDHDEPGRVRVGVGLDPAVPGEGKLADHARGRRCGSTWPVTPVVPGGPSGRRWPTPKRRTSIGIGRPRPASGASAGAGSGSTGALGVRAARPAAGRLRPDRRLGMGELRAGEVALLGQLLLVHLEQRREAQEADPDHHRRPVIEDHEQDDQVEVEARPRRGSGRTAMIPVHSSHSYMSRYGGVAVEGPGPDVVEDDRGDEQDERRRPRSACRCRGTCAALNGVNRYSQGSSRTFDPRCRRGPAGSATGLGRLRTAGAGVGVCHGPRYTRPPVERVDVRRRGAASEEGEARVRALLSVANRDGIVAPGPRPPGPRRRGLRHRRHPRPPRRRRHRGRLRLGPDRHAAPDRRPGQDLPPGDLRGHPRPARHRRPDGPSSSSRASARSTSSSSTSARSPRRSAPSSSASTRRSR